MERQAKAKEDRKRSHRRATSPPLNKINQPGHMRHNDTTKHPHRPPDRSTGKQAMAAPKHDDEAHKREMRHKAEAKLKSQHAFGSNHRARRTEVSKST